MSLYSYEEICEGCIHYSFTERPNKYRDKVFLCCHERHEEDVDSLTGNCKYKIEGIMTNYQNDIMNLLQGDTPKQKYENLVKMKEVLIILAFPRRGTDEEIISLPEFATMAEQVIARPE